MKKEIEEDTNKWKHIHVHGLEELTSLKCPYYPKQSIDSMKVFFAVTSYFISLKFAIQKQNIKKLHLLPINCSVKIYAENEKEILL